MSEAAAENIIPAEPTRTRKSSGSKAKATAKAKESPYAKFKLTDKNGNEVSEPKGEAYIGVPAPRSI